RARSGCGGGRQKRLRAPRTQPQSEPQGDHEPVAAEPVHVAELHPDPAPAAEAEEDDGEQL
ncbi:hypothetical protein A2U01_0095133, partial [Trifolium medium]|nr:hypothetical protein [Trifolium medium]